MTKEEAQTEECVVRPGDYRAWTSVSVGHTVFFWCVTSGSWCASGRVPVNKISKCRSAKLTLGAQ